MKKLDPVEFAISFGVSFLIASAVATGLAVALFGGAVMKVLKK